MFRIFLMLVSTSVAGCASVRKLMAASHRGFDLDQGRKDHRPYSWDSDRHREHAMKSRTLLAVCSLMIFAPGMPAHAYDLDGAWTTGGVCEKIFAKTDNGISFRPDGDLYGGGFIVQGNLI